MTATELQLSGSGGAGAQRGAWGPRPRGDVQTVRSHTGHGPGCCLAVQLSPAVQRGRSPWHSCPGGGPQEQAFQAAGGGAARLCPDSASTPRAGRLVIAATGPVRMGDPGPPAWGHGLSPDLRGLPLVGDTYCVILTSMRGGSIKQFCTLPRA